MAERQLDAGRRHKAVSTIIACQTNMTGRTVGSADKRRPCINKMTVDSPRGKTSASMYVVSRSDGAWLSTPHILVESRDTTSEHLRLDEQRAKSVN